MGLWLLKQKNLVFVIIVVIVVIASSLMIIQTIEKTASEDVAYADTTLTGQGSGTALIRNRVKCVLIYCARYLR